MPTDLIRFPGDLITADLWNRMLALLDGLSDRLDTREARVVPDVVGDLLPTALDEIAISQLTLNTVFDVEGTKANPGDTALTGRIVIAQMPAPEEKVPPGSRMTLLITAPKVAKPNAPTITKVTPASGTSARVGQALDITGTNFSGSLRVVIRTTQLTAGQFTVNGTTQIHIPAVPNFEGAPTPGTSKDVPITVGNEAGDGSAVVNFFAPASPAAQPTISNVRFVDATKLRILGTNLKQDDQVMTVTMGGQSLPFLAESAQSLTILMPDVMRTAYGPLVATGVFNLLSQLDAKDALLVSIVSSPFIVDQPITFGGTNPADFANTTARLAAPAAGSVLASDLPITIGRIERFDPFTTTTRMKLFLTMSALRAQQAQSGIAKVVGNTVLFSAQNQTVFSVDVNALQDLSVVVKAGDKSTTFVVKFGSIPDQGGGGTTLPNIPVGGVNQNFF